MMQKCVSRLLELGKFPSETVDVDQIQQIENLLLAVQTPITDEEAKALCSLFGPDDFYELPWTIIHLVETAPGWPIEECLVDDTNEWIETLKFRIANSRKK